MGTEETVTMSKSSIYHIIIALLVITLAASVWTGGFGINKQPTVVPTPSPTPAPTPTPTPQQPQPTPTQPIPIQSLVQVSAGQLSYPKIGSDSAPLVMVEFSDFQCPFCERFYTESFGQIKDNYVKTGKLQIIYRNFPLSFHQYAEVAAGAAECAHEQGKWEEMHNMLFEKQNEWTTVGKDKLKEYAKTIGLDPTKFDSCLDTNKYKDTIGSDFNAGIAAGVEGTPTFFIGKRNGDGQRVVGAQPYDKFKAVIDAVLAQN